MAWIALVAVAAAEVTIGGGFDVAGGVVHAPGAWNGRVYSVVEGDLRVQEGAVDVELGLDVGGELTLPPYGWIVPEIARIRGDVGPLWLGAGIAPAPWRVEAVDGWDTTLVTWSVEDRHILPGSALAAEVGIGTPERGVVFLGGLDLGRGLDLLHDAPGQLITAPILTGVHGRWTGDGVQLGGGVFAWPDSPAVAAQVGAVLDFDSVRLAGQAVGGWNTPFGGHVQAELFPDSVATPTARVEVLGVQPGGAVGVVVRPVRWLDLKAEVAYSEGIPQAWVEVAGYGELTTKKRKKGKR